MATVAKKTAPASRRRAAVKPVEDGSDTVTVTLNFTKETTGTYRFDHPDGREAHITSLYVRKAGFPNGAPQSIVVTVKAS